MGKELQELRQQREAAAAARQRELEQQRQEQAAAVARRAAAAEERRRRKVEEAAREKEERKQQLAARLAHGAERAEAVQQERHDVAKLQASAAAAVTTLMSACFSSCPLNTCCCCCCCKIACIPLALIGSTLLCTPGLQRVRHAVTQQRRAEAVRERSLLEDAQRLDFMQWKQERHAEQLERAAAEKAAAEVGWAWLWTVCSFGMYAPLTCCHPLGLYMIVLL